jgi:hypothetical protein
MTKDLTSFILEKIKGENICQKSKWQFTCKNFMFWAVFIIAALLGSKAIGIIIYATSETDFTMLNELSDTMIPAWTGVLPFFWITAFATFIILAIYGLHHTKNGYKYAPAKLITLNLAISMILGSISFQTGMAKKAEEITVQTMPAAIYTGVQQKRQHVWAQPSHGRLMGTVMKIQDGKILILDDPQHQQWTIKFHQATIRGSLDLKPNVQVRLGGKALENNQFEAKVIAPWKRGNHFRLATD